MKRRQKNGPQNAAGAVGTQASITVAIDKPVYGGSFLARAEGKAVFVPLVLPGEQASIRIVQNKSGYSTAELEQVVNASPQRVAPACPYFGACGGCNYQQTSYENQIEWKRAILCETLERGGVETGVEIATLTGEPWAYRNRIRVAFDSGGRAGYRGRRSHAIISIEQCPIAAPLLIRTTRAAEEILERVPVNLRPAEMLLFCNADESQLLVTFFAAESVAVDLARIAKALQARVPELVSAMLASDGRPGRPPRTRAQWGTAGIEYTAAGFAYRVDQGAFFQVNRWLLDQFVEYVAGDKTGKLAWDLFAGVGLFARKLTASFDCVVAVESAPPAIEALKQNLAHTHGDAVGASALDFLRAWHEAEKPDLIVVDPPRSGLETEMTSLLAKVSASQIVYVSCDPATLARDLRALTASGYAIEKILLADLFPQTFHLETVVHLRRSF